MAVTARLLGFGQADAPWHDFDGVILCCAAIGGHILPPCSIVERGLKTTAIGPGLADGDGLAATMAVGAACCCWRSGHYGKGSLTFGLAAVQWRDSLPCSDRRTHFAAVRRRRALLRNNGDRTGFGRRGWLCGYDGGGSGLLLLT